MKKLIIMLFLVVTSISFSIGRYKAIVLNGQKEYSISMKADSRDEDLSSSKNDWNIKDSSRIFNNGHEVNYIEIEKDGDIIDGIVPIRLVVSSGDSEKLLNGPLLQVIQAELYILVNGDTKTLEYQYATFIKNIDEVIIKKNTNIDLGTLYSGEELKSGEFLTTRILQIKYGTHLLGGGYYPMIDVSISGSGTSNSLKVEGGHSDNLTREIELINQRIESDDHFKIKGIYFIDFRQPENSDIDLRIYGIPGEYPKTYGTYKGVETINITLY